MPTYDPSTALLVVDVQHDFADPKGSLYVRGAEEIVRIINEQVDAATTAGALIVYSKDWHPESTPHFQKDGGRWPVHCVHDTWGAEFDAEMHVPTSAVVIHKGVAGEDGYSAFSVRDPESGESWETPLGDTLEEAGIRRAVICGLTTDYCVVETAVDARARGLEVEVLTSAIRAVDVVDGDGRRALERMRQDGVRLV